MNALLQDLRYAVRQLRKSPGFTITAIITLALGIGANTAIFTLVNGILLRSLPVANPSQLYRIGDTPNCCVNGGYPSDDGDFDIFSYALYQHLKESAPEYESLAAVQAGQWHWSVRLGQSTPRELQGEFVSGNFFSTLGINSFSGRLFSRADDTPTSAPVLVLSFRSWQTEFGADPAIVGSTVFVQTKPYTVVGIAPPGFFGDRITDTPADFWMPLNTEPYLRGNISILHHDISNWLYAVGRIRPGTNLAALQLKLSASLRQWLATQPIYTEHGASAVLPKQHVVLSPAGGGIQNLQQQTGKGLTMLMILSSVVLLIACANIANLMLARSTSRRAEIAVRMAMGAARKRVTRQILTESMLLGCVGGLAGLAVAYGGAHTILALAFPDARNMPVDPSPSLSVLGFAFGVSLLTGILFGVGPAWLSSKAQPAEALRGANRSTRDGSSLPQKVLVIFQAALSLVLLTGAILMTKSLAHLQNQDFGIATTQRYVLHLDPAGAGYTIERLPALYRQIEDRFSSLPGVQSVSMALYSPLEGDNWGECVIPEGHPAPGPNVRCGSTWDRVSTHFLQSIGVPIVNGRDFKESDTATSPQVALVNEAFVKAYYPNKNPVGERFGIDMPQYSGSFQIVGVFRDFKINNPRDAIRPVYLRPLSQQFTGYKEDMMISGENQSMFIDSIIVSFKGPQADANDLMRRTLTSINPNLTVTDLRTLNSQVEGNFNGERLIARLTGLFGVVALILASIGLYGVMSYFVARRTSEIGIRMALGATRSSVVAMIMQSAALQIVIGLAIGIPCALIAGKLMASQLYGVGSYDPAAFMGATAILALCAMLAGFIPARRAASTDPMKALRTE
ncbi:MAG TPA: ABC transporter permease [Terracidiphilus sp.]|nr:ABC transporter permease [Terracidiphilus sp.]